MPGMMETLVGKDKYSVYRVKRGVFKRGYVGKIDKKGIREKLVYRLQDVKKKTDEDIKEYINKINFDEDDMNSKLSDIKELKSVLDKLDRKSTRLNSSHVSISYAVFCLKKKTQKAEA